VQTIFGDYAGGIATGLQARHDHGSQYVSDYFQDELKFLGIESSPAFVREPEGDGVAERFIRTLKEQLLWVRTFDTVEELRVALLDFKERYNREWLCASRTSDADGGPRGAHGARPGGGVRAVVGGYQRMARVDNVALCARARCVMTGVTPSTAANGTVRPLTIDHQRAITINYGVHEIGAVHSGSLS
jgi:hypothetical protein